MNAGYRKPRGKRKGHAKSPAAGSAEKKLVRTPSKRIGVLTDEELATRSPCCDARCHNVPMAHVCAAELRESASHEASCTYSHVRTIDTGTVQQPQQRQRRRQQRRQQSPSRGPMARSQRRPRRSAKRSSPGRQVGKGFRSRSMAAGTAEEDALDSLAYCMGRGSHGFISNARRGRFVMSRHGLLCRSPV